MITPCAIAYGPPGIAVAMPGASGLVVALFDSARSLGPRYCRYVGPDLVAETKPAIAWAGTSLAVAGIGSGRGFGYVLEGDLERVQERFDVSARSVAMDVERGVAFASFVNDAGIVLAGTNGRAKKISERIGIADGHSLVVSPAGAFVIYGELFGRSLGVIHQVEWERKPREVRHALRAEIRAVHAAGAGARVGVAITFIDGTVDFAILDSQGGMAERPHALRVDVEAKDAKVIWRDRSFSVVVSDGSERAMVVTPGEPQASDVRVIEGPYELERVGARSLLAAKATAEGVARRIALVSVSLGEELTDVNERLLVPDNALAREGQRETLRVLHELPNCLGASGYREGGNHVRVDSERREMVSVGHEGATRVRISLEGRAYRVELTVSAEGDETALSEPPPSTLIRLARALRSLAKSPEIPTWATEAVEGLPSATIVRADRAGVALTITVRFETLPPTAVMHVLVERLRAAIEPIR